MVKLEWRAEKKFHIAVPSSCFMPLLCALSKLCITWTQTVPWIEIGTVAIKKKKKVMSLVYLSSPDKSKFQSVKLFQPFPA